MAVLRLVLFFLLINFVHSEDTFRDNGASWGLARYIRTLANEAVSSEGRCRCEECEDCVCEINGAPQDTDATWAAIVAEDFHFKHYAGSADKLWPPKTPLDLTEGKEGHKLMEKIDGKQEPLLHLKRFPETLNLWAVMFLVFDNFSEREKIIQIHYNDEQSIKALPTYGKVYLVIHGWLGSARDAHYFHIQQALLDYESLENQGVVMVEWSQGANFNPEICLKDKTLPCTYDRAAANVVLVGRQVGLLSHLLVKFNRIDAHNIHYIGFGLGAQVAHFAAQWYQHLRLHYGDYGDVFESREIGRLTALDPSAKHFQGYPGSHVTKSDARFVDVIHTSSVRNGGSSDDTLRGRFGMSISVGSIDFYPNGGHSQPLCSEEVAATSTCSHFAAIGYFLASLDKSSPRKIFTSVPCRSWDKYFSCEKREASLGYSRISSMGIEAPTYPGHGDHFLHYNSIRSKVKREATIGISFLGRYNLAPLRGRNVISPRNPEPRNDPLCGLYAPRPNPTSRIINGNVAYEGQFPWTVGLTRWDIVNGTGVYGVPGCSGTILNDRWILTAAHCFDSAKDGEVFYIAYGMINVWNLNIPPDPTKPKPKNVIGVITERSKTIFLHPDYKPKPQHCDPSRGDDIALIYLQERLPLPENKYNGELVNSACFLKNLKYNKDYSFSGFGQKPLFEMNGAYRRTIYGVMHWIGGKQLTQEECKQQQIISNEENFPGRFCGADNKDFGRSCVGDSGGGAVAYFEDKEKNIGPSSLECYPEVLHVILVRCVEWLHTKGRKCIGQLRTCLCKLLITSPG